RQAVRGDRGGWWQDGDEVGRRLRGLCAAGLKEGKPMATTTAAFEDGQKAGALDRLLRPFGDVRSGEGVTVLLLLANIFLIMAGYYICKTVREPLILAGGGAEVKSYAAAGMAVVLMGFIPLYSWFASRVDRMRLITGVLLFFIANLEMFWLGAKAGVPY